MCKYLVGILSKNTKGGVSSPTSAGFITLFQFCNKTQVANKSASCLAACTDFLVTVCKYSEVACMKAATHKEFPQKKKRKRKGSGGSLALDQRFGTKMASMHHTYGALSAGVMFALLWFCSWLVSFFYFTTSHRLYCVTSLNFLFTPINDYIIFPSNIRYLAILHEGVFSMSTMTLQSLAVVAVTCRQSLYSGGNAWQYARIKPDILNHVTE